MLHRAAGSGDVVAMRGLIEAQVNVNLWTEVQAFFKMFVMSF